MTNKIIENEELQNAITKILGVMLKSGITTLDAEIGNMCINITLESKDQYDLKFAG